MSRPRGTRACAAPSLSSSTISASALSSPPPQLPPPHSPSSKTTTLFCNKTNNHSDSMSSNHHHMSKMRTSSTRHYHSYYSRSTFYFAVAVAFAVFHLVQQLSSFRPTTTTLVDMFRIKEHDDPLHHNQQQREQPLFQNQHLPRSTWSVPTMLSASSSSSSLSSSSSMDTVLFQQQEQQRLQEEKEPWIWNSSLLLAYSSSSCDHSNSSNISNKRLFLHDQTLQLDPCIYRPWLEQDEEEGTNSSNNNKTPNSNSSSNPKHVLPLQRPRVRVKLLLTNFGWNHPDRKLGLSFGRSIRQLQFVHEVINHPLFDPRAWEEYNEGRKPIDPNVRYYVFLDVETCFASNYPVYGAGNNNKRGTGKGERVNADVRGGRPAWEKVNVKGCYDIGQCSYVEQALQSRLFKTTTTSGEGGVKGGGLGGVPVATLVYFDCRGNGPTPEGYRRNKQNSSQLALVTSSSAWDQLRPDIDQGLPPPAVSEIVLSDAQVDDLKMCHDDHRHDSSSSTTTTTSTTTTSSSRPYLLTFVGSPRPGSPRDQVVQLHNASIGVMSMYTDQFKVHYPHLSYHDVLAQSQFAAAPRGDNRFSFRFTEVLAAGAIPVVHSDGWVLPFRPELIDWTNECAVVIPEQDIGKTLDILNAIGLEQRCRMRLRCYEIYRTYMATRKGNLDGILQGLELVKLKALSASTSVSAAT